MNILFILEKYWHIIIILILSVLLFKKCDKPPKIKTEIKTVTKVQTITDTIIKFQKSEPKIVYIPKTKIIEMHDTITKTVIIKDSIKAKEYDTELKSNKATASLKVTTEGELYNVTGVINYPKTTITKKIKETIYKNRSGLFLYGQSNTKFNQHAVGIDYQIKNKVIIGVNIDYNTQFENANLNFKLGFKL